MGSTYEGELDAYPAEAHFDGARTWQKAGGGGKRAGVLKIALTLHEDPMRAEITFTGVAYKHTWRCSGSTTRAASSLSSIVYLSEYPKRAKINNLNHLGTLETGNHFVEACLVGEDNVWFMWHSGSRGVGNAIGPHFIFAEKISNAEPFPTRTTMTPSAGFHQSRPRRYISP